MIRCAISDCGADADLTYLDHGICESHWNEFTTADALARALGITTTEVHMSDTTMPATETVVEEKPMPTKKSAKIKPTAKATKPAKAKPAKVSKAAKAAKPKKERTEKPGDRVFAIRVSTAELEAIHKAAGPRNATRLVRALTAAFVNEDATAFKAVVEEARAARG